MGWMDFRLRYLKYLPYTFTLVLGPRTIPQVEADLRCVAVNAATHHTP